MACELLRRIRLTMEPRDTKRLSREFGVDVRLFVLGSSGESGLGLTLRPSRVPRRMNVSASKLLLVGSPLRRLRRRAEMLLKLEFRGMGLGLLTPRLESGERSGDFGAVISLDARWAAKMELAFSA
mmetsp:Transcript_12506/g.46271  ORF Transcript_12506/g.46271 Transcript_12506/m.46271 type:complete len:126 (-) Transcript_12506:1695-2072(-)